MAMMIMRVTIQVMIMAMIEMVKVVVMMMMSSYRCRVEPLIIHLRKIECSVGKKHSQSKVSIFLCLSSMFFCKFTHGQWLCSNVMASPQNRSKL